MLYLNLVLYSFIAFLIFKSIMIIPERQSWVIQRLGKFNRISLPGLKASFLASSREVNFFPFEL